MRLPLLLFLLVNYTSALSTGWRVALNIGREPFTQMPASWASSGCRLPIVVPCDFEPNGQVIPKEDVARFTGPDGEVVVKIESGKWSLTNERNLCFEFIFPERFDRRDVILDPCTVQCKGLLYSKKDLKEMNDAFYRARDKTWQAGELVNDIERRKEAPKKWDEVKQLWVKRYPNEGIFFQLSKRANALRLKQQEKRETIQRPNPKEISLEYGPFPTVEGGVFIKKLGTVTIKRGWNDVVVGTWSAEPINDKPVSYYNS
jgi:hypothetical protein